ncbi:MAG: hypothetical protein AABY04_01180 [Candidatus Micrarchaeota archaeon]|mgnify:FL=1
MKGKATEMDKFGRITLPKEFRHWFNNRKVSFEFDVKNKQLILKPILNWDEMRGFAKNKIDLNDLVKDRKTKWH